MVKLAREFQIKGANDLAVTNLGYYRYRAYPVTVWIGMLGDDDVDVKRWSF